MKVARLETFLVNAGVRNYLFVRLTTDTGITGVGEASLEWQERAVEVLLHDWLEERVLGRDPFEIERFVSETVRDQYQGGSTVMTAISGVEIALWDIVGKACNQPVYNLLGGRVRDSLPAYANGWYGGCRTPEEYATRAVRVVERGYGALKFDPFGTAWRTMTPAVLAESMAIIDAVAHAAGDGIGLMIECHGRFAVPTAVDLIRRLEPYNVVWCEEPVGYDSLSLLEEVKRESMLPISAGERLYTMPDFFTLTSRRAADVVQMDIAHCGGLLTAKKIAAMAAVQDMSVSPHCSIGPVALAASVHFGMSTPNMHIQESFAEFDVAWRDELVCGWNPLKNGTFTLDDKPGLGLDIDVEAFASRPYVKNSFPNLWDDTWTRDFTRAPDFAGN